MSNAIEYNTQGNAISFNGEGVNVFRAALLASSIGLYSKTKIIPTRGVTITKMLKMAEGYTGRLYKRTQLDMCIADLNTWVQRRKQELA